MAAAVGVDDTRAALTRAGEIGPYFAVDTYDAAGDCGWRALTELWTDPACLTERVDAARDFLSARTGGEVELRACASINSLGLVSRLVSPALATACGTGVVMRLSPQQVYWRPVDGGPVPIALARVTGTVVATPVDAAAELERAVLEPCVLPVLAAYADRFRLSEQVLRGNVASALAGAAGMLVRSGTAARLPPIDVVDALLGQPVLAGSGHYERPFEHREERFFVRHNCCLFYRVPAGGKCGDCVLVPDIARRDMWRAALEPAQAGTGSTG